MNELTSLDAFVFPLDQPLFSTGSQRLPLRFLLDGVIDVGIQEDQTSYIIIITVVVERLLSQKAVIVIGKGRKVEVEVFHRNSVCRSLKV